jgi:hypothetical protein
MDRGQSWAERWKPAAGVRTHLLAAALLWTCVGTGLLAVGALWCFGSRGTIFLLPGGLLIGAVKGHYIIRKMAMRNVGRIAARGEGKCLGGFISPNTWLLVLAMMSGGIILRHSSVPQAVLGVIYTAVGTALLTGSLRLWKARAAAVFTED